jgi:PAS domain-containing protein
VEEEFTAPDGSKRVLLTTKSPLRDLAGDVVSVLTTSLDISDRKAGRAAPCFTWRTTIR